MKKTRILFVCHGYICRSPMAEFVMKDLVKKAGLEDEFYIGNFEATWRDVLEGCEGILEERATKILL